MMKEWFSRLKKLDEMNCSIEENYLPTYLALYSLFRMPYPTLKRGNLPPDES